MKTTEKPSEDARILAESVAWDMIQYVHRKISDPSKDIARSIQSFADSQTAILRAENEALKKANIDCVAWYDQARAKLKRANETIEIVAKQRNDVSDELEKKNKRIGELEKELSTPILVNTARLADQLSKERDLSDLLYYALKGMSEAYSPGVHSIGVTSSVNAKAALDAYQEARK